MAGIPDIMKVLLIMRTHVNLEFRANLSGEKGPTLNTVGVAKPAASLFMPGPQQVVLSPNQSCSLISRFQLTFYDLIWGISAFL